MKKIFTYRNHTFKGIRQFHDNEDFKAITKNMFDPVFLVTGYPDTWSHAIFYNEAKKVSMDKLDVFLMDDTFEVVPASNGLFIYGVDSYKAWQEKLRYDSRIRDVKNSLEEFRNQMIVFLDYLLEEQKVIELDEDVFIPITYHTEGEVKTSMIRKVKFHNENEIVFEDKDGVEIVKSKDTTKSILTDIIVTLVDRL